MPAATAVASAPNRTRNATGEPARDEIFDTVTLYWLTNTEDSAPRLNCEYKGGHFAAWEQPRLFSQEVRAAFRPLR